MDHLRTAMAAVVVTSGLLTLACSGIVAGTEIAGADVTPGTVTTVPFTPTGEEALWLDYDVGFSRPYGITGDIVVLESGAEVRRFPIILTADDGPVVGETSRLQVNQRESSFNGAGSASAMVWCADLEGLTPGVAHEVHATLGPTAGTTVNGLRVKVMR